MIGLPVSVLDIGLVQDVTSTGQSLGEVIAMARRADELGFLRFWVAEHHGSQALIGAVPAVMISRLAAETASIRIGAGGVILPNHSPVAVAEQFGTLGALDPGRIDLGIGRGPGSFNPGFIEALRQGAAPLSDEGYGNRIRELLCYFEEDKARSVRVSLAEDYPPEVWLLASSASGAAVAAELGLPVSFAYHIRPENTRESLTIYRDRFKPSQWRGRPCVMLSVGVACAETDELAAERAQPTEELLARDIGERLSAAGQDPASARQKALETIRGGSVRGGPETVGRYLAELVDRFAPDELVLVPVLGTIADRLRCLELISEQVIAGPPTHGCA
jgi:luciferase family oxidoreductase group 1